MNLKNLIIALSLISMHTNHSMEKEPGSAIADLRQSPFGAVARLASHGVNTTSRKCCAKAIAILAILSQAAADAIDDQIIL